MAVTSIHSPVIRGITSCVPEERFDNLSDATGFPKEDVAKVVRMAGVKARHVANDSICSSDLCLAAARDVLQGIGWDADTVDGLIFVTQSPDYFLPSTACLIHRNLGLRTDCAAFDVGLGCSGYPYGLWLGAMMLSSRGFKRVLVLHGETPTRFSDRSDRSVALLFGDAGSATALESDETLGDGQRWWFSLNTDGQGYDDLIIRGGGFRDRFPETQNDSFVTMNGSSIFDFTIKRVPQLAQETMGAAGVSDDSIDYYVFHQSNRFIMNHLARKMKIDPAKIPITLDQFGNAGGPSIPLTVTMGGLERPSEKNLELLMLGYGVGLSWASALVDLCPETRLNHVELENQGTQTAREASSI